MKWEVVEIPSKGRRRPRYALRKGKAWNCTTAGHVRYWMAKADAQAEAERLGRAGEPPRSKAVTPWKTPRNLRRGRDCLGDLIEVYDE